MIQHMGFKTCRVQSFKITIFAGIFTCMNTYMTLESVIPRKSFVTIFTSKWFFTSMDSLMHKKIMDSSSSIITILARVWFFIMVEMNKFVCTKILFGNSGKITSIIVTFEGFFSSMLAFMGYQYI